MAWSALCGELRAITAECGAVRIERRGAVPISQQLHRFRAAERTRFKQSTRCRLGGLAIVQMDAPVSAQAATGTASRHVSLSCQRGHGTVVASMAPAAPMLRGNDTLVMVVLHTPDGQAGGDGASPVPHAAVA
jgi:hypothetical protein